MDAALQIIRTFFNGRSDKVDKKIVKSSSTSSNKPNRVKSTSNPKTPQTVRERAKVERLLGRRAVAKAPATRTFDDANGLAAAREGRGESIQIGTGGIADLVPGSGQGGTGGHGSYGGGADHTYSSYDGGGGDGGGGC